MSYKVRLGWRVGLLAILVVALFLRVYRLGGQSLWYDEAVTAQVASQGLAELTRWTADDIQPPLYYYVVAGWTRLAGRGEWALRFPSAFFGTLTVALLWATARRLFGGGRAGHAAALAAALLAALSPLYVYYAQEARMYTQLTFLGLLSGYALLRAGEQGGRGWWLVFVLAAAALLYTHYFGVFLLAAYGICFLAAWLLRVKSSAPVRAHRSPILSFGFATLAILLLYLPWLPAMLNRYRVDRSYWQGALKLNEALRHVAISFTTGAPETMLERDAARLLPWFGLAFVLAAAALLLRRGAGGQGSGGAGERESGGGLALLLAVLIVPVVAVLLLASRTPKFNPRYLMLASPAYLLILAGGFGALVGGSESANGRMSEAANQRISESANERIGEAANGEAANGRMDEAGRSKVFVGRIVLAAGLAVFLIAISLLGLRNWFTDPAFTKAQWRELAATVRAERAPDESVLLVSGHASPAWDYYAADIPRVRLPDIDILDVNAVLGFDTGAALATGLAGKAGAWLVSWQDDVVDPAGFVPYFLERAGTEQPVAQKFWHLGLRHWRLNPDAAFPAEPEPAHAQGANFDHKLALLGWDDPVNGQLAVYWRTLNTLPKDYRVSLILEDAQGRAVGRWDGRPAGYDYPTTRWQPGQALFGRYPLPLPAGAAPGEYTVTLAVYDESDPSGLDLRDVADNPAGKRVRLGPIRVGR